MINGELLEHLGIRASSRLCFFHNGQFEFFVQDNLQLLGRIKVEGLAGDFNDLGLQGGNAGCKDGAQRSQPLDVYSDAVVLNVRQNAN